MPEHAFKTDSEKRFDEYLQRSGVKCDYELLLDGHKPDFWLNPPDHDIICEVTEVERYLSESGSYDGAQPLRNKVSDKAKQGLGAAKARLAYVVVIDPGIWPVHSIDVIRSMFGDRQFTESGSLAGGNNSPNGVLGVDYKTDISAVAVLRTVHSAQRMLDERVNSAEHDGSIHSIGRAALAAKKGARRRRRRLERVRTSA